MNDQLKTNLTSSKHWIRLVYMLLFALILQAALAVMWVLIIVQFLFTLVTGSDNINLRSLGSSLAKYIHQTLRFLSFNSEEKPFPFSDWPKSDVDVNEGRHSDKNSDLEDAYSAGGGSGTIVDVSSTDSAPESDSTSGGSMVDADVPSFITPELKDADNDDLDAKTGEKSEKSDDQSTEAEKA